MMEPAWKSYVQAGCFLLPALLAWVFAEIFLQPALQSYWHLAGMGESKFRWLMEGFTLLVTSGRLFLLGVILIFLALEFRLPSWPKYRRSFLMIVVFIFNSAVFFEVLWLCTSALMICRKLLHSY